MTIASGFLVVDGNEMLQIVSKELLSRGFEVHEKRDDKIVFLIERETIKEIKEDVDALKWVEGVKGIHVTYFSAEDADKGPDIEIPDVGEA